MDVAPARALGLKLRYACDLGRLPPALRERFVQLGPDHALGRYLELAAGRRHGRFKTGVHRVLRGYLSDFEINGLLGTYPMHVLGTDQWRYLLESPPGCGANDGAPRFGRLLDVGSGDGDVTAQLAPLFEAVTTTEMSRTMAWRLRRRGFACFRGDVAAEGVPDAPYDVISCLNVLDRCDHPLRLLASLRAGLEPHGLLIVALVLPYQPFVYDGAGSRDPAERLPLAGRGWENLVGQLCGSVLEPLGLSIQAIARVPYLSGGDASRALYELDDALVVCRAEGEAFLL